MRKIEREYRDLCGTEGVEFIGMHRTRKHYRLVFHEGSVVVAGTPSDRRNLHNVRAAIRRCVG